MVHENLAEQAQAIAAQWSIMVKIRDFTCIETIYKKKVKTIALIYTAAGYTSMRKVAPFIFSLEDPPG